MGSKQVILLSACENRIIKTKKVPSTLVELLVFNLNYPRLFSSSKFQLPVQCMPSMLRINHNLLFLYYPLSLVFLKK